MVIRSVGETWRYVAVVLIAASGCDVAFGLEAEPPPGLADYDKCGAFLYDDPLRYAAVMTQVEGPWSWDAARAACQVRGMDLAVLNDMHELSVAPVEGWPFWIGERSTTAEKTTVDGCPAVETPTAQRLVADGAPACGVVAGPLEIDSASCDGALPDDMGSVLQALCETPRPDDLGCVGNDPAVTKYVLSEAPMTYADAVKFCADKGGYAVVAETAVEWRTIARQLEPFWVGSRFEAGAWQTVNGCPATYAWTNNTPGTPADGSCIATRVEPREGDGGGMATEGVEPTACDEARFALCEID